MTMHRTMTLVSGLGLGVGLAVAAVALFKWQRETKSPSVDRIVSKCQAAADSLDARLLDRAS